MSWTAEGLMAHIETHMAEALPAHRTPLTWHGQYDLWTIGKTADGRDVAACIDRGPAEDTSGQDKYTRLVWNVLGPDGWEVSGTYAHYPDGMMRELEDRGVVPVAPDRVGKQIAAIRASAASIDDDEGRARFLQALQEEIEEIPGAHVAFSTRSAMDYVDEDLPLDRAQQMLGAAAARHTANAPAFDDAAETIYTVIDDFRDRGELEP